MVRKMYKRVMVGLLLFTAVPDAEAHTRCDEERLKVIANPNDASIDSLVTCEIARHVTAETTNSTSSLGGAAESGSSGYSPPFQTRGGGRPGVAQGYEAFDEFFSKMYGLDIEKLKVRREKLLRPPIIPDVSQPWMLNPLIPPEIEGNQPRIVPKIEMRKPSNSLGPNSLNTNGGFKTYKFAPLTRPGIQ